MTNFYITGYRAYELGIFSNNDLKVKYLKNFLNKEISYLLDQGIDWLFFTGQSGIEYYAFQEATKLKEIYSNLRLAVLFPFADFGDNFTEQKAIMLAEYKTADFVAAVSKRPYEGSYQLKYHTQFILEHTQGTWMLYDNFEQKGKSEYFYQDALKHQEVNENYQLLVQNFDDLNQSLVEL